MPRIKSFGEFIIRTVWLIFWIVLILAIIVLPIIYLTNPFPISLLGVTIESLDMLMNLDGVMKIFGQLEDNVFFKASVFPGFTFAALFATVIILWERKLMAKIQVRVGPLYAGRIEGVLQPIADLFKLLFKELLVPKSADKLIFFSVPFATLTISAALLAVIPASETWVVVNSDVGLLVVFAAVSFYPIVALLAGWASNSKYPFMGGLRALHQMIAYEIPMVLSVLGIVILTGSLSLVSIVKAQSSFWFILIQPIGALVFFCCTLAELERIPFDLPEAEPEIASGWLAEFSGMVFGSVQLANYIKFYGLAAVFTSLFLGGWYGPAFLPAEVWFVIKVFIVSTAMILPRAVNPRVRIDIMLRLGWAGLLILAFINIFIALLAVGLGAVMI